jgi:hypothetical protein
MQFVQGRVGAGRSRTPSTKRSFPDPPEIDAIIPAIAPIPPKPHDFFAVAALA